MSMEAKHVVTDVRTASEKAEFAEAMPTVSPVIKRLLERADLKEFARLLPAFGQALARNHIRLPDITMMGGGILVVGEYKHAEKVFIEIAGGASKDAARAAQKDYLLHEQPIRWRQSIIAMHQAAQAVVAQGNKSGAREGFDFEGSLDEFEAKYTYRPSPEEYTTGLFAKNLDDAGLSYPLDDKTDWRRAKPSDGRHRTLGSEEELPEFAEITKGGQVLNALVRKFTTIAILHGMAPIDGSGFDAGEYGKLVTSEGIKTHWITIANVKEFASAAKDMKKLSESDASEIADWLEGHLHRQCKKPRLASLARALMLSMSDLQSRLASRIALAAMQSAARRVEAAQAAMERRASALSSAALPPHKKPRDGPPTTPPPSPPPPQLQAGGAGKLQRMTGGNPDGPPCKAFANGTCKGKCRFKHPPPVGAAGDVSRDEGGEDDLEDIDE